MRWLGRGRSGWVERVKRTRVGHTKIVRGPQQGRGILRERWLRLGQVKPTEGRAAIGGVDGGGGGGGVRLKVKERGASPCVGSNGRE